MGIFRTETVGAEVKLIASFNPRRRALLIVNDSENEVYISEDQEKILREGIPLYAYEALHFDTADGDKPEKAFYAQAPAGIAKIRIYEAVV